ncbi:hypothetical protein HL42_5689 [Trichophyton rubrum]|nr:hypothetical protein HL42_5689 [Trichophyton rubrum]
MTFESLKLAKKRLWPSSSLRRPIQRTITNTRQQELTVWLIVRCRSKEKQRRKRLSVTCKARHHRCRTPSPFKGLFCHQHKAKLTQHRTVEQA